MKRCASSASDISRLNSATAPGVVGCSATFSAMFVTRLDFPIDGRAAMMIRLPGWKPPVISSRSAKPDGCAGQRLAVLGQRLPLLDLGVQDLADAHEVLGAVVVGDLEDSALGDLDDLARQRLVVEDRRLDLVGLGQQPPQQRVVADDAPVLADVADRRDGAGEPVDLRLAAGVLELAARPQVLGDGQPVDRLGRVVQREHRLVDELVAAAVEVLRPQPLLDDEPVDALLRQQDRPEHRLLGLERVRRREADLGRGIRARRTSR